MEQRTIVVSGGSRGLGLAMVGHLLCAGHRVVTFARTSTPAVEELALSYSGSFHFVACDGRDREGLDKLFCDVEARFGVPFGLVNNAAVGQDNLLVHMRPEAIAELIAINIAAPILLTRAFLRRVLQGNAGARIVNVGSICGLRGYQGLSVYSATKGAMDAFTRSLSREVGSRGVLVNSIVPGFFDSEMSRVLSKDQMDSIRRRTATGLLTEAAHLLPVLDLLMFGDINMSGQSIVVDGGSSA